MPQRDAPANTRLSARDDEQRTDWFIETEGHLFAWLRAGVLGFEDLEHRPLMELDGDLARELLPVMQGQCRATPVVVARLRALRCVVTQDSDTVFESLLAGSFKPVQAVDVVRADGYQQLWIELSLRCNERCLHCYADASPERTESLERVTVFSALSDARELGFSMVQFTGGEPLLCDYLPQATSYALELGLEVEIFTNGLLLDPARCLALCRPGVSFAFSLYGADSAVHDRITRTPGSFEGTLGAIARVRDSGSSVRVGVIAMEENRQVARAALDLARTLVGESRQARLVTTRSVGRGRILHEELESEHLEVEGAPSPARAPVPPRNAHHGRAVLCADGEVRPCVFMRWLSLGRVGRDGTLAQILRSPRVSLAGEPAETPENRALERLACGFCQRTAVCLEGFSDGTSAGFGRNLYGHR